ncbi:MAG: NUDIX domain-containing protein [Candidatus Bathyarchaeota archaeon]|nr:NUDIX domain-containing protein [Candidatus Bathyarchaeota archaeon]
MIPSSLYERIVASMPIPSVEAMIMKDSTLLFLKRKNHPVKGEWWFPGGRIRKGETFKEALLREVKEETGLDIKVTRYVGTYNRIFWSAGEVIERHDITIAFLCECLNETIALDSEHSEYRFFKEIPNSIHPFLLETIQDSGWNPNK